MNRLLILISALLFTACTTMKDRQEKELSERVMRCHFCAGSDSPGGPCYKGPGGAISQTPGGECYAGPGGKLNTDAGGNLSIQPGGRCSEAPGGNCANGPGADGKRCSLACRLNKK